MVLAALAAIEGADATGEHDERVLRGDVDVVRERRERAAPNSRGRNAMVPGKSGTR